MRIVVALGGNALLRRGESMSARAQRANVRTAAVALAPLALEHELVVTHGNGPQVGLLALQAAAYAGTLGEAEEGFGISLDSVPLDVLGAESEGMIGYMIEQELGNLLPIEKPLATILTMVEVDPKDPAFQNPSKPIGPVYTEAEAQQLAELRGWTVAEDGRQWRRVVPSPLPRRIFQLRPIRWLLEKGSVVICAGGGGIPTMFDDGGRLTGAEVVVDKDRASALLAKEIEADLLVLATDVDGVFRDWGGPDQEFIAEMKVDDLLTLALPGGSMGSKVEAACDFVSNTGHVARIGSLDRLSDVVAGSSGTSVVP